MKKNYDKEINIIENQKNELIENVNNDNFNSLLNNIKGIKKQLFKIKFFKIFNWIAISCLLIISFLNIVLCVAGILKWNNDVLITSILLITFSIVILLITYSVFCYYFFKHNDIFNKKNKFIFLSCHLISIWFLIMGAIFVFAKTCQGNVSCPIISVGMWLIIIGSFGFLVTNIVLFIINVNIWNNSKPDYERVIKIKDNL